MTNVGKGDQRFKRLLIPGGIVFPLLSLWVAFSCSRYYRIPDIHGLPQITFERLLFLSLVVSVFLSVTLRKIPILPFRLVEIGLWSVTGLAAVSGVVYGGFASRYAGAGITILLNLLVLPATVVSITARTSFTKRDLALFCFILTLFGLYLAVIAILERTTLSWIVFPPEIVNRAIEHHWGRSRGPFLQAEFNATVMAQLVPPALLLGRLQGAIHRILGIATAGLLCFGIFLTGTRTALAGLLIVLVLGVVLRNSQRRTYAFLVTSIIVCGVVAYVMLGNIMPRFTAIEPIHDRLKLLAVTYEMISDSPVTGIGYGNFDLMQERFFDPSNMVVARFTEGDLWTGGTHNTVLTLFAELGMFGGALFLVLLLRILFHGFALSGSGTLGEDGETRDLVVCSLFVCLAFVVNALAVELRYTLTPNALFWIFATFIERRGAGVK